MVLAEAVKDELMEVDPKAITTSTRGVVERHVTVLFNHAAEQQERLQNEIAPTTVVPIPFGRGHGAPDRAGHDF